MVKTGTLIVVVTVTVTEPANRERRVVVKIGQVIISVNPPIEYGDKTKIQGGSHVMVGLLQVRIEGGTEMRIPVLLPVSLV